MKNTVSVQLTGTPFYIPSGYLNGVSQQLSLQLKKGRVRDLLHLLHSAADPVFHWDEVVQHSASAFLSKEKKKKKVCIFLQSFYSRLQSWQHVFAYLRCSAEMQQGSLGSTLSNQKQQPCCVLLLPLSGQVRTPSLQKRLP